MDIREMIEKCKPFAPVVSAAVVAACVAGSLYGYEAPVYEMKASVEDTQEQEDEVPVVKTSTEEETKEDEAAEEEEQAKGSFDMEDGVYQGTGTGYRGNITVAVTIKDKQITSIEILSASDDEPFFGRAKGLIDQIIKKQSTKVDTVSGATYSSKGIISAVKNALTGEKDSGTTGSSQEGTSASQSQSTPEAVGILVRRGFHSGEVMVVLVLGSPILPSKNNFVKALRKLHPEITTVVVNINDKQTSMVLGEKETVIYGKGYIEDTLCGCTFRISPKSFYQVNPVQTEILYNKAITYAGDYNSDGKL